MKKKILFIALLLLASIIVNADYYRDYNQGIKFLEIGNYNDAESKLLDALKAKPDFTQANWALIKIYLLRKEYPKVLEQCDQIIKFRAKETSAYVTKADTFMKLQRYKEARYTLDKLFAIDPKSVEGKLIGADLSVKEGNTDEAARMLKEIIDLAPGSFVDICKRLGQIYVEKSNFAEAEKYLKMAVEKDTKDEKNTLKTLAYAYFKNQQFDKGAETLSKVAEKKLDEKDLEWLGVAFKKTGDADKAILYYEKLYAKNPKLQKVASELAELYKVKGNTVKAAEYMKKASEGGDYTALYKLGSDLLAKQKYAEAIPHFEKSINANAGFYGSWYALGMCYYKTGQKDKALKAFEKSLDLKSDYLNTLSFLAIIYDERNLLDKAKDVSTQIVKLKPDDPEAWFGLAMVYGKLGNHDLSAAAYAKVVELDPKNKDAWYNLHIAYNNLGNTGLAADALKKFQELGGE